MKKIPTLILGIFLSVYSNGQATSTNDCGTCLQNSSVIINGYTLPVKKKITIIVIYPNGVAIHYSNHVTGIKVSAGGTITYTFNNTSEVGSYRVIICEEMGNQLRSWTYTDFEIISQSAKNKNK